MIDIISRYKQMVQVKYKSLNNHIGGTRWRHSDIDINTIRI